MDRRGDRAAGARLLSRIPKVQDIHAQLWRSFAYFEGQCSERSWVYRVAHNVAVSHMMTRRRRDPYSPREG